MKSNKKSMNPMRQAIAMVELIFAIVVIGITLLSAPMLLRSSMQSSNIGMQQEAIAAVSSEINLIMSRQWDERDTNAAGGSGILDTESGLVSWWRKMAMTTYFIGVGGTPSRSYNRFDGFTDATSSGDLGADGDDGLPDDIDDFNGLPQALNLYSDETANMNNNEGEYMDKEIRLNTQVAYGNYVLLPSSWSSHTVFYDDPFANVSGSSDNVKLVRVTLNTNSDAEEMKKTISLSAFSCNIGSPGNDVVVYK